MSSYRLDNGIVCKTGPLGVWVTITPKSILHSECKSCNLCAQTPRTLRLFVVTAKNQSVQPGTHVTVKHYVPDTIVSALIVFGIPVALPLCLLFLWYAVAPESAQSIQAVLACCLAVPTGMGISVLADRAIQYFHPAALAENNP
ncbi:MAG: hypothetical protein GF350_17450 [Chitinivibrionales bacterium]|nr:hypothetical protein [Chitinivibrionales bacterium]